MKYARMLNGYTPIFTSFGNNIYASDVVQQAVSCIVFELKKLTPVHERGSVGNCEQVDGTIQSILDNPNELMTQTEFIEKIVWNLLSNYNSFVLPTYEGEKLTGLYPLNPTNVDFLEDNTGKLFIKMLFQNEYETTVRYSDVIHIRYRYSSNEFMGGDESGHPDHSALLQTLKINNSLMQGIEKGIETSYQVNGIIKYNTMLDGPQMEKSVKELEERLRRNESCIASMDLSSEFVPITRDLKVVDTDTLKFVDEKILRHWGVPLPILTGDYTKEQYDAFYQKTLEPIIIALSQSFTKGIFTKKGIGFKNKIVFYPKELIFMTTEQKLEMVRLLGDSGALYENEKRVIFGWKPLPELKGKRNQSLNYIDVDLAKVYQARGEEKNAREKNTNN